MHLTEQYYQCKVKSLYQKESVTFSDAFREVKQNLWRKKFFNCSMKKNEPQEIISKKKLLSMLNLLSQTG